MLTGSAPLSGPPPFKAPTAPAGQLPDDVLERRPDVRACAALLQAQAARLSSAKTDLLPRFQFNFLGQGGRLHFEGIPELQGACGLASLSVQMPIFTAGYRGQYCRLRRSALRRCGRMRQGGAARDRGCRERLWHEA